MSRIYLHIPFCKKACTYCNFHFSTSFENYRTQLVDALKLEIELSQNYLSDKKLKSIYFGGGTPSLLNFDELNSIIEKLHQFYQFDPDGIEMTLEANPDDLTLKKLKALKKAGINRLSIGVQSFDDKDLLFMNRSHNANQAKSCLKLSQDVGIDNISMDLIFGLPNSTIDSWHENLKKTESFSIPHLSIYNLTIEPKTLLNHQVQNNLITVAKDKLSAEQFYLAKSFLESRNYTHYETSNYAIKDYLSQHNTSYWKGDQYLGIGPGAHSFNGSSRQWNVSNNQKYMRALGKYEILYNKELLTEKDKYNEYILTGFRTMWGCDMNRVKNFGEKYFQYFEKHISKHITNENVYLKNGHYILTHKALIYSDMISSDLMYV